LCFATWAYNRQIPGCGAHHIAVQASDWDGSLRLYRDVLGMPIVAEFGTLERRILLLILVMAAISSYSRHDPPLRRPILPPHSSIY